MRSGLIRTRGRVRSQLGISVALGGPVTQGSLELELLIKNGGHDNGK